MKRTYMHGFSIIEMIVVIAVIGLLVAIIIPSLAATRKRARKTQETNLISQSGKAWTMYSGGHQERLLPGYLTTEVQEYRSYAWAFADESIVPPAPTYDSALPNDAGPWPWRILEYMDNDWSSLLFYRDVDWDDSAGELVDYSSIIATQPAFGYNGYYLGGKWYVHNHSSKPRMEFNSVTLTDQRVINVVALVASHIKKPNNQIVFCSTFNATPGVYRDLPDDTAGTHFAIPSVLARVPKWDIAEGGGIEANFDTYVPLGRFNGLPAVCFADGHTETVEVEKLLDQQMWISKAQTIGDIPASDFSHTQ